MCIRDRCSLSFHDDQGVYGDHYLHTGKFNASACRPASIDAVRSEPPYPRQFNGLTLPVPGNFANHRFPNVLLDYTEIMGPKSVLMMHFTLDPISKQREKEQQKAIVAAQSQGLNVVKVAAFEDVIPTLDAVKHFHYEQRRTNLVGYMRCSLEWEAQNPGAAKPRTPCIELDDDDDDRQSTFTYICLLYTSPSPRDVEESRMPSSA